MAYGIIDTMDGSPQLPDGCRHEFPHYSSRGLHETSASMKAAANPDSRILRAVLACRKPSVSAAGRGSKGYRSREDLEDSYGPNSIVGWPGQDPVTTPLLQAIRCQLLGNANVLLETGVDPLGIDMDSLESYQALFLGFQPEIPPDMDMQGDVDDRRNLLKCMELPQTASITEVEIEQRTCAITPFWRFPTATPLDYFPYGNELHSLVAAARQPSTEIFDRLLSAGADASFWISKQSTEPDTSTPSSLTVTTLLHAAIESGNIPIIHHLLSNGFDANVLPVSTPHSCLTPLMAAFLIPRVSQHHGSTQPDETGQRQ